MADKNETTSTDLGNERYSATDAETGAFDLNPFLVELMWSEPFYARILRGITKKRTEDIPTAGVMVKDGEVTYLYNPRFAASLVKDEGAKKIKGLNIHECLHLVYNHCSERKLNPFLIWNYATDCAINSVIPRELLPDCGIIPGEGFTPLTEEQKEKMTPDRIAKYQRMSDFIEALPKGLSSEEYFAKFMQNEDFTEEPEEGEGGEGGEPGEGGQGIGMPGTMDDHGGWGEDMNDQDREIIRGKMKQVVGEAVKECDAKGSWGSVPAETRAEIRAMISKEIPWQSVLKKFLGFSRRADRSTSRMRLNKKYPGVHSGYKRGYTSSIATYIDQSGSVGNTELELLFAELANLAKRTEFITYHFDTDVDEQSRTTWKPGKTPQPHRTRCGGTCFTAPTEHANKRRKEFDGYLILTDGYAPDPGPSRLRRGWIITPDGQAQDWMRRGNDFVIEMKWPAEKSEAA
jgi:predicted metal-dependent peptidase|tara:strand:+ start:552 stop:1931 length:1380 start_codon:yes stop_codon:yes gene_type:complete